MLDHPTGLHHHLGTNGITIGIGPAQPDAQPVMPQVQIIAQHQRRPINLCHHHIEPTIAGEVAIGCATPNNRLPQVPQLITRHHDKTIAAAFSAVPKQLR